MLDSSRFSPLCLAAALLAAPATAGEKPVAVVPPTFEAQVRPLFRIYCFDCHGEGEKLRGNLDLRLRRLVVKGGDSGPAVVAGKPDQSLLLQRVRAGEMPPGKKKLSKAEVALIGRWIAGGAKVEHAEPETIAAGMHLTPQDRAYWAYQPIRRPPLPAVRGRDLVRTPIDAFLLTRLESRGLTFAPEADRRTLLRRVTFDLTGLPPTPAEIDAFLADRSPHAYERVVERLLVSPRYGEHWGRHWLDVAGYADSEGFTQEDALRPHAYKYRDYVIRALNADKPFDEFVREQLAGDEMRRVPSGELRGEDLDRLIATGFLRMAPDGTASRGVDQKTARNQVLSDTIKIVSTSLMGLTVGCAQCHNHKYDPIPQADYYRLRAILEPAYDVKNWRVPAGRRVSLSTDADRQKAQQVEVEAAKIDRERLKKQQEFIEATFSKEVAKLPESLRDKARAARTTPPAKRTAEQKKLLQDSPSLNVSAGSLYLYDSKAAAELKKLADQAAAVRARKPVEDFVRALTEIPGQVPATFLFHRGDPDQPKQAVAPGGLTILDEVLPLRVEKVPSLPTTGRRLALARWLTDPRHPLTGRVLVNRVWMHHFGKGLVATPGDFGRLGERPTHPELLDWLASEFIAPASGGVHPASGGVDPRRLQASGGVHPASGGVDPRRLQASGGVHLRRWSLKRLHRLLVTSTAYRQSSQAGDAAKRLDPDNRLLGRMPVRRLEAEAIRDGVLAISGNLSLKMFGPAVPVRENDVGQVVVGKGMKDLARGTTTAEPLPEGEANRRSVYVQVRRSQPLGVLETFDGATAEPNCECRNSSTVTPQALMLMNNEFILEQAEAFAARLLREAGTDPKAQVRRAWRLVFAAEPTAEELSDAVAFLAQQEALIRSAAKKQPDPRRQVLATFCQALLSSNRFLYVD